MKKQDNEYLPLYKQFLLADFTKIISKIVIYRIIFIFSVLLFLYSFIRFISFSINIRYYLIFSFNYFIISLSFFIFILTIYKNYLGKFLRIIDIKTIYETYMVYKRKDSILALDLLKTIEKNVSLNEYSKIKIKLNFKIIIIILSLSLILFFAGSTISYFQYGKIVYKIVPYEYKEVLTMEYMVEQFLSQLEKDSDQYKYLNKLYEQIKVAYSKGGINQKEYLEKLNQILAKSTSLSDNTGLQKAGTSSISNKGEQLDAQDVIKNEKKQYSNYDNLAKKYIKEKEEDEKITKESSKVELLDDKANQNFFEFLKNELFHPDTAKEKGLAGYQSQNIKSSDKYSVDYSLLLQSIYSNSKDFSYSLSNQLSESKKIEIFNYLVKQYNFSNKDITYDEELFYKLIILYFDQLKKYGF